MAEMTPELKAAIDVAKQRVKVDSYWPKSMKASLQGNAQGFWAGTFMGFLTGGLAGGLIWAALAAASISGALIGWPLVLGVAGIGGTAGGATGARIAASAGSTAASTAELERRLRADKLEQEILASPEKQQEVIEAYRKDPVVEKEDSADQIFKTSHSPNSAINKIIDWRTMLVTIAVCAAASMALFAGSYILAGGALVGTAAGAGIASGLGALGMSSLSSALAIGAGAGAAMGVAFGISYPPIFSYLTQKTADLLSGKIVRGKTGIVPVKSAAQQQQEAVQNRIASEGAPQLTFSRGGKAASLSIPETSIAVPAAADRIMQSQPQLSA